MMKRLLVIIAVFIAIAGGMRDASAQTATSNDLIVNDKTYDGRKVVFVGEAIGDVMKRGDFAWVNVSDDIDAIGIWMPYALAKDIVHTGSYKEVGDTIEVVGIFHRACPEHGGDLDIHAQAMRILKLGKVTPEKLSTKRTNIAIILLAGLGLLWILTRSKLR